MRKQQLLALAITIAMLAVVATWLVMRGTSGARPAAAGQRANSVERDSARGAAERTSEHTAAPARVERLSKERRRQRGEQIRWSRHLYRAFELADRHPQIAPCARASSSPPARAV